jgi:hypothetical protein
VADLDLDLDFDLDLVVGASSGFSVSASSAVASTSLLAALFLPFLPALRFAWHVAVCEKGRVASGRFQGAWLAPTAAVVNLRLGV